MRRKFTQKFLLGRGTVFFRERKTAVKTREMFGFDTYDTVEGPSEKKVNAARLMLSVGGANKRAGEGHEQAGRRAWVGRRAGPCLVARVIGTIKFNEFACFFSSSLPVFHSFAQTGSLGRWLDRRAGSPGVITSFFCLFWSCRFQQ